MCKVFLILIGLFDTIFLIAEKPNRLLLKREGLASNVLFKENRGQVCDQYSRTRNDILFIGTASSFAFQLRKSGISYQLNRIESWKEVTHVRANEKLKCIDKQTIYRVDIEWLNSRSNLFVSTDSAEEGYENFYLENCPNGVLFVKSYTGVTLHNLYEGIDLLYYSRNGELKHDYVVAPYADYKQIHLRVEGATVSITQEGSLVYDTPLGTIEECKPIAYQDGRRVEANWKVHCNDITIQLGEYDRSKQIVIDPITRVWGTYYGGAGTEYGFSCARDTSGSIYLAGSASSSSLIATTGSHQQTIGGANDAFIACFNTGGSRLWSTYYGGNSSDYGYSCTTDLSGYVYLSGTTASAGTVMATAGSHQQAYGGGSNDAFLVKFNNVGIRQWGTYYGGSGDDSGHYCATDSSGSVFLAGNTDSNTGTVIATAGSHQQSYGGGSYDGYLVKMSSSGFRQWATYYGGSGTDYGLSCATDRFGNVYLAGYTESVGGSMIATNASHQQSFGGGLNDAYLAKFDIAGVRQWATYYGGSGNESGYSCCTDSWGDVYLTGFTYSGNSTVISTNGCHQPALGGNYDAFLVKFRSNGIRLWGTYYGIRCVKNR